MITATTRLEIEYDGSGFRGWAAQRGQRTVQGELEAALATILRRQVSLTVAGRTDAGVHAWGQVASFEDESEPPPDLSRRLNGVLPDDVVVKAATAAPEGFDARRDARSRTYCYRVQTGAFADPFEQGRSLWFPRPIDREKLNACAAELLGSHDFTAFTPTETDHVHFERKIFRAEWMGEGANPPMPGREAEDMGGVISFWIEADAFMYNMVRALVGTMLEVASGRRAGEDFKALLDGAPRERAGETVPAHGLYLASVRY
jgi:tRNA pseudouridine38-40 synthase